MFKWLDLGKFCSAKLPQDDIHGIKYFTAKIEARPDNPKGTDNQEIYWRALRTIPCLEIVQGFHQTHPVWARIHQDDEFREHVPKSVQRAIVREKTQRMRVLRTEEKLTDVNLAAHMIRDAALGVFDLAVLVANDADYKEALKIVTQDFSRKVGLISPYPRPSQSLKQFAMFTREIGWKDLENCQFPNTLTDSKGSRIFKPSSW